LGRFTAPVSEDDRDADRDAVFAAIGGGQISGPAQILIDFTSAGLLDWFHSRVNLARAGALSDVVGFLPSSDNCAMSGQ
jgi:hypothetical protein